MSIPVGRNKAGELIRIYENSRGGYNVEVGGSKIEEVEKQEAAIDRGKIIMLKSFMPSIDEHRAKELLQSDVVVDYNFRTDRPSTYRKD